MTVLRSTEEADCLHSELTEQSQKAHILASPRSKPPLPRERFSPLATDIPACRELYKLNEAGRFPPNLMEEYERTLAAKGTAFLVARLDGELVGAGGLMRVGGESSRGIGLVFGLVHPAWQRRGLGSALLLALLAALPEPNPYWNIALSAVESAQSFYQLFGFIFCGRFLNAGVELDHFAALLSVKEWRRCRLILNDAGVTPAVPQLIWK